MPCQSRVVGFLIVPLQLAREHDSILIDVLALHCMHKKHLICFYKNLPVSDFHPTAHLLITEFFNSCFGDLSWNIFSLSLVMYEVNYFPIDFLASWVAQDAHEQYRMSGLEPYASDSRGRLS